MVPAYIKGHKQHSRVMPWLDRILAGEVSGVLSGHSLAETYSVLTRIPPPDRISPEFAWQAIERNLPFFEVITLTEAEIVAMLSDLATQDIGGGTVYDALIAAVARKANVDVLLTFNTSHFLRVAPDLANRIQEP